MRRGKESDDVDDDEKKREESEEERKATGGSELEDGVKFGEQLQDDLINTFCDKLQKACPRTLDAFMAIQFLMITDEKDIRRLVTGTNPALQVLYDRTRSHYVLVYYNPKYNKVFLFDSLQPYDSAETPQILNEMVFYISRLFGHLFTKHIPVIVDKEFQRQAHAGYYNPMLENYRANSERYTRSIPPRNLYPYRPSSPLSAPYFQAPPTPWRSPTALGPPPPVDNTLISCIRNFANQSIFNGHIFRRKSDRFELENDVEKGLGVVEKREEE
ncbi:hypothetical protein CRE_25629 [Caenorhabditis remanei]|uniref:Uncharacterized protein n=1 Tax=Caenorhabditis remanei TaxID=31234 RepID=E3ML38_CAERE|nr:hypothetical protein CRE_25629 [Caenorhabditis remanei]